MTLNSTKKAENWRDLNIAVLFASMDQAGTIAKALIDLRREMPGHRIFVYDRSEDTATAEQAALAGGIVVSSNRKDRASVVRQMFTEIEADIFLLVDGDGSFDATTAPRMIQTLITDRADMVVAATKKTEDADGKPVAFSFDGLNSMLLGTECVDIRSKHRAVTRRFAKSFITQNKRNDIEVDMSVYAAMLDLSVSEVYYVPKAVADSKNAPIPFEKRVSMTRLLLKETRPFILFANLTFLFMAFSLFFMAPVLIEAFQSGTVSRMPSWILASVLLVGAVLSFCTGITMEIATRIRVEQSRIHYQSLELTRGERVNQGIDTVHDRRDPDGSWIGSPLQRAT